MFSYLFLYVFFFNLLAQSLYELAGPVIPLPPADQTKRVDLNFSSAFYCLSLCVNSWLVHAERATMTETTRREEGKENIAGAQPYKKQVEPQKDLLLDPELWKQEAT